MEKLYTPEFGYLTDLEDIRIYKRQQQEKEYEKSMEEHYRVMEEEYYRKMEEEYYAEQEKAYNELFEYLQQEWRKSVHTKYHVNFDEWFRNLTDNQLTYFMSWKNGQISPYCEKKNI